MCSTLYTSAHITSLANVHRNEWLVLFDIFGFYHVNIGWISSLGYLTVILLLPCIMVILQIWASRASLFTHFNSSKSWICSWWGGSWGGHYAGSPLSAISRELPSTVPARLLNPDSCWRKGQISCPEFLGTRNSTPIPSEPVPLCCLVKAQAPLSQML